MTLKKGKETSNNGYLCKFRENIMSKKLIFILSFLFCSSPVLAAWQQFGDGETKSVDYQLCEKAAKDGVLIYQYSSEATGSSSLRNSERWFLYGEKIYEMIFKAVSNTAILYCGEYKHQGEYQG